MKKALCITFIILLILTTLTACKKEPSIIGSWVTEGSIPGLSDETETYNFNVVFNDDNTGKIYKNSFNSNNDTTDDEITFYDDVIDFEYSLNNGYITLISYDGEVMHENIHTYPCSIEENTLSIKLNNKHLVLNRLIFGSDTN